MEEDKKTTKGEASASLRVSLHPLVILTISDHHTRAKLEPTAAGAAPLRIVGALLGTQRGRDVEVSNCFEIIADIDTATGDIKSVDMEFLRSRAEQFKKVFEEDDVLGWYTNGPVLRPSDIEIHKQMSAVNENALLLQLDTESAYRTETKELPIKIYESEVHVDEAGVKLSFVNVNFRIATAEAERIGVDHVAHVTPSGASQLTTRLLGMHGTIKMLNLRVRALGRYVEATRKGEIPYDHSIMRQVKNLCDMLPTAETPEFRERFTGEFNDAMLVAYLTTLTKAANTMNELVDKHLASSDRSGRHRGGVGFFA